ncbi:helix-turn-helix domain-containing protein [Draconibacterium mangrovi]|uniref:helix-turn-helix domain-containing protein n=1 Tax=Draconibacterium mangrovi TaxID=2697469 RepID=UPI0013D5B25C|nr:helix-turn-helix domain-containing protein [Draconibacterium mangrovi]
MELNFLNIASLFYIFASLILIVFLLSSDTRGRLSNIMLSLYLLLTIQDNGSQFTSIYIYEQWPIIGMLISQTTFLIIPSLYLFVKSSVYSDFRLRYSSLLHAGPMIIFNLLLIPVYYKPLIDNPEQNWVDLVSTAYFVKLIYISIHTQIFVYYIFIFRMLLKYRNILLENYASPKLDNYKWLFQFISILFFAELIATVKNIYRFGDNEFLYSVFVVIVNILVVIIIFWLVIKALKKPELFIGVNANTIPVNQMIKEIEENTDDNFDEELSGYKEIIKKLENHMKVNEPFMDSSLSVYDLAKQINVPSRDLSIAINHIVKKHFFDYVNEYRIKKAMEIFKNTNDEKLTVLEVLYEVGFNSKSSFNTAFKKFTGTTPSEFKKKASNSAA